MLNKIKKYFFQSIRKNHLYNHIQDLKNYLWNVEVQQGCSSLTGKKILVLAPHPDDESIGCGGTLRLLTQQKNRVDVIFLTAGENAMGQQSSKEVKNALSSTRKEEAKQAAKLLGINKTTFLHGEDGSLHKDKTLVSELSIILKEEKYEVIFSPWAYDGHSDHAASFRLLSALLKHLPKNYLIWFYETWTPLLANHIVSIDSVIGTKIEAIECYKSQTSLVNYTEKVRGLAQHRSLLCHGSRYAEAFFSADSSFMLRLQEN